MGRKMHIRLNRRGHTINDANYVSTQRMYAQSVTITTRWVDMELKYDSGKP